MRTEQIDPRYVDLDTWSASEMIAAMYEGQLEAAGGSRSTWCYRRGRRGQYRRCSMAAGSVYVGAGTSGRIGVQDGAELCADLRLA